MSPAQRNYDTADRELLAIIRALQEWRHYILGSAHETLIFSDHANLTYFKQPQKLTPRQARWALYVSEFKLLYMISMSMISMSIILRNHQSKNNFDGSNENNLDDSGD